MSEQDSQQPGSTPENTAEEVVMTKTLQLLLERHPQLQEWRDMLIAEQIQSGKQRGYTYHDLRTPENQSKYFGRLPHSTTGWMIRAFSPENALLKVSGKHTEREQRQEVVIDPFLAESFGKKQGNISLAKMRTIEDMRKMVRKIQTWFKNTNPIASGRVVVSPDGTVGLFQEKRNITQNTKMSALKRAKIQIHDDIYSTINAHNYAKNTLREDQKTVIEVSDSVAALVAACMIKNQGTNVDEHVTTIHELVASITSDLEDKATFFYLEKMMIDYLLKLNGGQYDSTRVYWAAQTLQTGLRDRLGKNAGITEQMILLEQAKNIELYHWKNVVYGTHNGRVNIEEVLESISGNYEGFKEHIRKYTPLKDAPVFNPFCSFYREWGVFLAQKTSTLHEAQIRIARQYILITLQEIKTRYAYNNGIEPGEIASLKKRIVTLEKLREQFFSEKPAIVLDFSTEKTTLNEALKKEIARYK